MAKTKKNTSVEATKDVAANKKQDASQKKATNKTAEKSKAKAAASSGKKPNLWTRFTTYLRDVRLELKRVVWPTKKEVLNASLVVVGALIFFGLFIYAIDSIVTPLLIAFDGLA